ncbi:10239_t:CDS:2, partial [Funneliformis mosseae]
IESISDEYSSKTRISADSIDTGYDSIESSIIIDNINLIIIPEEYNTLDQSLNSSNITQKYNKTDKFYLPDIVLLIFNETETDDESESEELVELDLEINQEQESKFKLDLEQEDNLDYL